MQKINFNEPPATSPFFELLAEAEEIKIREVVSDQDPTAAAQGDPGRRTFYVHIRTKPAPSPAPSTGATPSPTAEGSLGNRLYLLKSAELLMAENDFVLARNIYSYLLKNDVRDPEGLRGLGLCFMRLGETTSARKCFKALWETSGREDCLLWLGQSHATVGDDVAAIDYFKQVTAPEKLTSVEQFDLHRELGNCLTRRGCLDEAWEAYHRALGLKPDSDIIHVNLGTLEIQRNHPDVALSYFNKAVQINPKSSRAHCGLGLVAAGKDDLQTAGREFLLALDLDSQNLVALLQLVTLTNKTGAFPVAEERLEIYLNKDPKNTDVRYALAAILYKAGEWSRCTFELDALLRVSPDHAKARSLREELSHQKPTPT